MARKTNVAYNKKSDSPDEGKPDDSLHNLCLGYACGSVFVVLLMDKDIRCIRIDMVLFGTYRPFIGQRFFQIIG